MIAMQAEPTVLAPTASLAVRRAQQGDAAAF